jgi:hypothetical protein
MKLMMDCQAVGCACGRLCAASHLCCVHPQVLQCGMEAACTAAVQGLFAQLPRRHLLVQHMCAHVCLAGAVCQGQGGPVCQRQLLAPAGLIQLRLDTLLPL